jgi:hypothetical protein
MSARAHSRRIGLALLAGTLAACGRPTNDAVLIFEGSYTGTTSSSCQMAVRASDGSLVDSYTVEPTFRQEVAVASAKGRYHAEILCPDGKRANTPEFDFEPPREKITLGEVELY